MLTLWCFNVGECFNVVRSVSMFANVLLMARPTFDTLASGTKFEKFSPTRKSLMRIIFLILVSGTNA